MRPEREDCGRGEYGGHSMRLARVDCRRGEYGGHFEAPVPK